jgi:hypothetical protein
MAYRNECHHYITNSSHTAKKKRKWTLPVTLKVFDWDKAIMVWLRLHILEKKTMKKIFKNLPHT